MQLLKTTFGLIAVSFGGCLAVFVILSIPPSTWPLLLGLIVGFIGLAAALPLATWSITTSRKVAARTPQRGYTPPRARIEYDTEPRFPEDAPDYYPLPPRRAPRRIAAPDPFYAEMDTDPAITALLGDGGDYEESW